MARITLRVNNSDHFDSPIVTEYMPIANAWLGVGTEAQAQLVERQACVFKHLSIDVNSNGANGITTYRFRNNGDYGNASIAVPASTTGKFQDLISVDTVVAGDKTCLEKASAASTGNITCRKSIGVIYPANHRLKYYEIAATTLAAASTFYYCLNIVSSATEATAQTNVNSTGQWHNLFLRVTTNTVGATSTFRGRKNTANGNQVITIPASTTGDFEDTTNVDVLANGDDICYQLVTGAGGTSMIFKYGSEITLDDGKQFLVSTCALSRNTNITHYIPPAGGSEAAETSETWVRSIAPYQFRASKLQLRVFTNTCTTTITFRFRNNQANGNQVITVATTLTGYFEDASNTDLVEQGNYFDHSVAIPSGTGAAILLHRTVLVDAGNSSLASFKPNALRPRIFAGGVAR